MKLAVALLLVASVAHADALAKGRKLANQKKYPEAIAAFEEGLKEKPDDPTLLGEAGFTAYLAKDYAKAETLTRKSLAGQATPSVRGATLYNLGLIREAKGDKAGAIAAYTDSVRVRPHRVVRAALAKLDAKAAAAADSLVPHAFDGPYASVEDFCAKHPALDEAREVSCTCEPATPVAGKAKAYADLVVFSRGCDLTTSYGHETWFLGAKVGASWYAYSVSDAISTLKCDQTTTLGAATLAGDTMRVPYTLSGGCITQNASDHYVETGLLVVGIGPSKVPSASDLALTHHEEADYPNPSAIEVKLDATWKSPTELELTGKVKGIDKPDLIGAHTLVFP